VKPYSVSQIGFIFGVQAVGPPVGTPATRGVWALSHHQRRSLSAQNGSLIGDWTRLAPRPAKSRSASLA
jgi:hypothetical protein